MLLHSDTTSLSQGELERKSNRKHFLWGYLRSLVVEILLGMALSIECYSITWHWHVLCFMSHSVIPQQFGEVGGISDAVGLYLCGRADTGDRWLPQAHAAGEWQSQASGTGLAVLVENLAQTPPWACSQTLPTSEEVIASITMQKCFGGRTQVLSLGPKTDTFPLYSAQLSQGTAPPCFCPATPAKG